MVLFEYGVGNRLAAYLWGPQKVLVRAVEASFGSASNNGGAPLSTFYVYEHHKLSSF